MRKVFKQQIVYPTKKWKSTNMNYQGQQGDRNETNIQRKYVNY